MAYSLFSTPTDKSHITLGDGTMRNRWSFFVPAAAILALVLPSCGWAQENLVSGKVAIVDGPYKIKGEIGIVGYVKERNGEKVRFRPCVGEERVIFASELELTQNTCSDGGGGSFAMRCAETNAVQAAARTYLKAANGVVETGKVFEQKDGQLSTVEAAAALADVQLVRIQTCNDHWLIGYDAEGNNVLQMLVVEPGRVSGNTVPNLQ